MVLFIQSSIEELEFFLAGGKKKNPSSAGCRGFAVTPKHTVGAATEELCT